MKKIIIILCVFSLSSCVDFLSESPASFLSSSQYYTSNEQIQAAVNGAYLGLGYLLTTEFGSSPIYPIEYITGYGTRPASAGTNENQFIRLETLDPGNPNLLNFWKSAYYPIENCNSVIENVSKTTVVDAAARTKYLGEVYFLRAFYYFQTVRLFGDIPLKLEPTKDLSDVMIGKTDQGEVYDQIIDDLLLAEASGLPWTDKTGHVSLGAVKSLLAKVYLTMAGYPLERGNEYYQLAFDKAKEVINSQKFNLFNSYALLRSPTNENTGEHIFMVQRDPQIAPNILHFSLMPYPAEPISISPNYGGNLASTPDFYNVFESIDARKQERAFFYTEYPEFGNPTNIIDLGAPYIYKYWDDEAEISGRNGANFPLMRYADVLLLCAEAKASLDGGQTTDQDAINAYFAVHKRAFSSATKPTSITTSEILKERFLELSFEFQTWYDMLRTRKALDTESGEIVPLIGYRAPNHVRAFIEADLLWPIPLSETQKNPALLQ